MTKRLFVDCDDTLVLWLYEERVIEGTTYFTIPNEGEKYRVNHELILAVNDYLAREPNVELVVWSGGGTQYALDWAQKFFPDLEWSATSKNVKYPQAGDICVDDQQLALVHGVELLTWEAFVHGTLDECLDTSTPNP